MSSAGTTRGLADSSYGVQIDGGRVRVVMTLRAPGCPLRDALSKWVRQAVGKIAGVDAVDVVIAFEPPWTPARMQRVALP